MGGNEDKQKNWQSTSKGIQFSRKYFVLARWSVNKYYPIIDN